MQDEQPIQYHVIQWRNSAFHQHSTVKKRKMLGGVSFDGDSVAGSSGKESNMSQTGVQTAQPSFPHTLRGNMYANGMEIAFHKSISESGEKKDTSNRQKIAPVTNSSDADKITTDINLEKRKKNILA